jgi:outer membrane lipoprotein LolB
MIAPRVSRRAMAWRASARVFVAGLVLVLSACAAPRLRDADEAALEAQSRRESVLAAEGRWSLSGRIAVSDAGDGGSGRITWRQDGDRYTIDISAPVSRRTWRLTGSPAGATLEGLDGGPRFDESAEALLRREVGWTVPFASLSAWVRGARGAGPALLEFDAEGRPARLSQAGWIVEFRTWNQAEPELPLKVFAARGQQRVRLVVERWDDGARLP